MAQLDGGMLMPALAAFAMIAALALVLRWTFGRDTHRHGDHRRDKAQPPAPPDDFGLLVPAAVVQTAGEAKRLARVLAEAGIRATTAPGRDGRYRVLVFGRELDRARRVGGWSP